MDPGSDVRHTRAMVDIEGRVQGVGFRPFIYRLAKRLQLTGWVNNTTVGVSAEVEGGEESIASFVDIVKNQPPSGSFVSGVDVTFLKPEGHSGFIIRNSSVSKSVSTQIVPDLAVCSECIGEITDESNRRFLYPFTSCTYCGPRFSILERLPYDRENTTMKVFEMCGECRKEYEDPGDRRFHSQTNACHDCGPQVWLTGKDGVILCSGKDAILHAAGEVRNGNIVALKGLGGFHIIVNALLPEGVSKLRSLKKRGSRPFALMYPDLESVKRHCYVDRLEERLVTSPESPIVLLRHRGDNELFQPGYLESVAPQNPFLGIMLPYTPLHHILMSELGAPVVATSGNISDETICTRNKQALENLSNIADFFLMHDRDIARHADDSVVRVAGGDLLTIRSARGYSPLTLNSGVNSCTTAAVGAQMKNTVAVSDGSSIFLSQHIGNLATAGTFSSFEETFYGLCSLHGITPARVACDIHPSYLSTQFASEQPARTFQIQHHYAHVLSCITEHNITEPVLGVAWDGTGYGTDGTIWGGEFLMVGADGYSRIAHLKTFALPGGDKAVKEPRRSALGVLYSVYGENLFHSGDLHIPGEFRQNELALLSKMLENSINTPLTSSAGRLFDAVSSLAGICHISTFEGQAAMLLEFASGYLQTDEIYDINILEENNSGTEVLIIDWTPMVGDILNDLKYGCGQQVISARFHSTLADTVVKVAQRQCSGKVVLTGGCFQNVYLLELTADRLRKNGFEPVWSKKIPVNDGGIAVGQIAGINRILSAGG